MNLLHFPIFSAAQTRTYPSLKRPAVPCIRTAPGSNCAPALPPSLEQKSVSRPLFCVRIPVSWQVRVFCPDLKRRSWQGWFLRWSPGTIVLRWSEKGDSLGVGAEKNPNALRRLGSRGWTEPCHVGTEGFRVSV